MRVAFLGNARWSVPSLAALAESDHAVAMVLTREPRPAGRGNRLTPTPVAEEARRRRLPLAEIATVKDGEGLEELRRTAPDVLAVVAYGEILPAEVLAVPSVAPVNVHFSVLPELRGAAPVQRAILEGLAATGVTTIRMDQGMDTGPILLHAEEAILPEDDAGSLGERLAAIGGRLLVDTVDRLAAGELEERIQDHALATYAPKLTAADRVIDWSEPAAAIVRRVRALSPEPGATTTFRAKVLKVLRASPRSGGSFRTSYPIEDMPRGLAVVTEGGAMEVRAADGFVALEEVAPEARKRMTGAEFVRGYRPGPGEILG
jgi:methionyl-tRNA formyltransferase